MSIQSVNPRTGESFGPIIPSSTSLQIDAMIDGAVSAFTQWSMTSATNRAKVLTALADALDANVEKLVEIADAETGLGLPRLTGEVGRTTFQIRSFAGALNKGEFVSPLLDSAVDAPLPQGHPKFLKTVRAIGPVAVFGASNFPFAFSVLGGDTASALAAGCSVVIKAHPAHPQTSQLSFDIAKKALADAGAPEGIISLGHGFEFGKTVITDPRMSAGAFTGSKAGGRALFDMAQDRQTPIPFYGELGSVNPVVVTESAMSDVTAFAGAYLDSLLMGNGQFCTNPSVLFVPESAEFIAAVQEQLAQRDPAPFLSQATKTLHDKNRADVIAKTHAQVLQGKSAPTQGFFSSPAVLVVTAQSVLTQPELLATECFGPTGVVVTYANPDELLVLLSKIEGALVGSLFSQKIAADEEHILNALALKAGRVAFNAWPTGVAVTAGQNHGGPYPASTSSLHTSVGTSAIARFLRPVAFQGLPDETFIAVTADPVRGK
ncbi:MAG: aldehyde dehydrogenase family protein [Actinomycetes bacterium]